MPENEPAPAPDPGPAPTPTDWSAFQFEIYLNGMTGAVPRLPTDLTRLEEVAAARLGPGPVGSVAGSAGDGKTARAKREAAAAAAREEHLAALAARGNEPWKDVQRFVESKQPKGYEEAVSLLKDMQEVAFRTGDTTDFMSRVRQLCADHAKKAKFIDRVKRAGLLPHAVGARSSA